MGRTIILLLLTIGLAGCQSPGNNHPQDKASYYVQLPAGFVPVEKQASETRLPPRQIKCLKDKSTLLLIPAGAFIMGSSKQEIDSAWKSMDEESKQAYKGTVEMLYHEMPGTKANIGYHYYIDKYEVTNRQYKQFCDETKRDYPPVTAKKEMVDFWGRPDDPVVNVTHEDALAYCKWAGKDLPLEAEWEKAARGTDGRIFPWGNTYDGSLCNHGLGKPPWFDKNSSDGYEHFAPVGSYPKGQTPYGVHDMAGNVWEWCKDFYSADANKFRDRQLSPNLTDGKFIVLKGGSNDHEKTMLRCAVRAMDSPKTFASDRGFRGVVRLSVPSK